MERTVAEVYENGVLRLLEPLDLQEHERVQVTIAGLPLPPDEEVLDSEYVRALEKMDLLDVSLEEVRKVLSKIPGTMTADFIEEREERF
jgi:predicted DNA-binding antitoxin AbrB/MazE fold protein